MLPCTRERQMGGPSVRDQTAAQPWRPCTRKFAFRTVSGVLVSALSLTACVFHQSYPSSWTPRSEGCEDVAGIYSDAGERWARSVPFPFTGTVVATRSLSGLLLGAGEYGKPFRVQLTQRDRHTLELRLWVDDNVGSQYSLQYRCTPQGVEVRLPARWVTQGLAVVRTWGPLYLTKDTDGDLIAKAEYHAYGAILILPIVAKGDNWYRFKHIAVSARQ
jgi:hypothetical protein